MKRREAGGFGGAGYDRIIFGRIMKTWVPGAGEEERGSGGGEVEGGLPLGFEAEAFNVSGEGLAIDFR